MRFVAVTIVVAACSAGPQPAPQRRAVPIPGSCAHREPPLSPDLPPSHLAFDGLAAYPSHGYSIVAGDFDGDGHPDLLAGDFYHGEGNGQLVMRPEATADLSFVDVADLNGDCIDDAVALDGQLRVVTVLGGQGPFRRVPSPVAVAGGTPISRLRLVDVDADGHADLAWATAGSDGTSMVVFTAHGLGDGTFMVPTSFAVGAGAPVGFVEFDAADIDGDGRVDLLLRSSYRTWNSSLDRNEFHGGNLRILDGVGPGAFAPPREIPDSAPSSPTGCLRAADYDGDGRMDILAGPSVWFSDGGGRYTPRSVGCVGLAWVADVNHDGRADIFDGELLVAQPDRSFKAVSCARMGGAAVAAADLDGDGFSELSALGNIGRAADLAILPGVPDGVTCGPAELNLGYQFVEALAVVSTVDVKLLASTDSSLVPVDVSHPPDSPPAPVSLGGPMFALSRAAVADFDGDGVLDAAVVGDYGQRLVVLRGDGRGGFGTAFNEILDGSVNAGVVAADFDGDGRADVALPGLVRSDGTGVEIRPGLAGGGLGAPRWFPIDRQDTVAVVADFDRDGRPDIALAGNTPAITVLLNRSGGFASTRIPVPLDDPFPGLVTSDLNGDGAPDLTLLDGERAATFLNNGSGTLTLGTVGQHGGDPMPNTSIDAVSADLDKDGCADLGVGGRSVTVLRGDCFGGFARVGRYASQHGAARGLAAVDVDGDGKVDLVGGDSGILVLHQR